ncbi:MAG: hypothetical protein M3Y43_03545 [Pseudomonadota bacterium]|nr:hypothetical protein [Pseudomonadota bacterium]
MQEGRARAEDVFVAEMLAYSILGHHAGLPDKNTDEASCFQRRLERFEDNLDPVWKSEIAFDLSGLMPEPLMKTIAGRGHHAFDFSVVARMLFSCLVDADYRDTETHYAGLEGREPDRQWQTLQDLLPDLAARFDAHMARCDGSGDRRRAAYPPMELHPGLFVTVPRRVRVLADHVIRPSRVPGLELP